MKDYLQQFEKIFKQTHRAYEKLDLLDRIELHLSTYNGQGGYVNFAFKLDGSMLGVGFETRNWDGIEQTGE